MGKEYIVNITDNASAGDGIARIDGLIIFVKDAKVGYRNVKIKNVGCIIISQRICFAIFHHKIYS
jgi:predicted RNA-binding protein with TRAM domain